VVFCQFTICNTIFGKLTAQLGTNDRLQSTLAWEAHHANYLYAEPGFPVETSSNYRSDDKLINLSWLHTFTDSTFMETKLGGWHALGVMMATAGEFRPIQPLLIIQMILSRAVMSLNLAYNSNMLKLERIMVILTENITLITTVTPTYNINGKDTP